MGSPISVLFANFFMGTIEAEALRDDSPSIYCRYIDDIFIKVKNREELQTLKDKLTTPTNQLDHLCYVSRGIAIP